MDEKTRKVINNLEKKGALRIIGILAENEAFIPELKEKADISNGTVQKRIKGLKEAGLIEEKSRVDDRGIARKVYRLSESGKKFSEQLLQLPICPQV